MEVENLPNEEKESSVTMSAAAAIKRTTSVETGKDRDICQPPTPLNTENPGIAGLPANIRDSKSNLTLSLPRSPRVNLGNCQEDASDYSSGMSDLDDDRDIDIENDDDNFDRRAHHNALERRRRDHIKDSFASLRDVIPSMVGQKAASRAQVLSKATDLIEKLQRKKKQHERDIAEMKRANEEMERQIEAIEKEEQNVGSSLTYTTVMSFGNLPSLAVQSSEKRRK